MSSDYVTNNKAVFVETNFIKNILDRLSLYLQAGIPVHLKGPAGTGKTTLALQLVERMKQPAVVIFGSDNVELFDLIGGETGYSKKIVIDRYNRRVEKHEEHYQQQWIDGRIAMACKHGYTLVYDEYTRSKPEVNNILLPVLEEGVIEIPGEKEKMIKVHPNFKAIFTSNPTEYAGVYLSQDALLNRMITINLNNFDYETVISITEAKSGLTNEDAQKIVDIVNEFRKSGQMKTMPTIRENIMLGKVVQKNNLIIDSDNKLFAEICCDILNFNQLENQADKACMLICQALTKGGLQDRSLEEVTEDKIVREVKTHFGFNLESKT